MMLLMFAVGAMNVVWMAALGVVMTIEKLTTTPRFSRAVGVGVCRDRLRHGRGCRWCRWRAMDLNEELRVDGSLVDQGRAGAVVQLHGVLPVRAVARPARADRRLLPDLGRRADRRGPFRRHRSLGREVRLHGRHPGPARPRQLDGGAVRRRRGLGAATKALTWIMTGRAGGSTALAENPRRPLPRRAAGADHLRDAGRDPHRQDREDRRRRDHAGARQGQGHRRHPQQRILDRARHHRVARRHARASACSAATGISRAARRKSASSTGAIRRNSDAASDARRAAHRTAPMRALAFSVHILTACGAALALLALLAAVAQRLGADVPVARRGAVVDGVDGHAGARGSRSAERLPRWSGDVLDLVVDFTTYVFVPAYAIAAAGLMPDVLGDRRRLRDRGHRRALFRRPQHEDRGQLFPRLSGGVEPDRVLSVCCCGRSHGSSAAVDRAVCGPDLRADPLRASVPGAEPARRDGGAARALGGAGARCAVCRGLQPRALGHGRHCAPSPVYFLRDRAVAGAPSVIHRPPCSNFSSIRTPGPRSPR